MRILFTALSLALFATFPSAQETADPITGFSDTDPVMNSAIATALETLPIFLKNAVDQKGYGQQGALLKASFDVQGPDGSQNEIIWIGPFLRYGPTEFTGLLANQPHYMPGLDRGDQVNFTLAQIRDWALWDENNMSYGNYTTRVIADTMGDPDGTALMKQMHQPAIPTDWK